MELAKNLLLDIGNPNITIGGGEPTDQMSGLIQLLSNIRTISGIADKPVSIILYSGHELYLWDPDDATTWKLFPLLDFVDALIVGPFNADLAYYKTQTSFIGSANQKCYRATKSGYSPSSRLSTIPIKEGHFDVSFQYCMDNNLYIDWEV
jgi:hypothetical protein